VKQALIPETMSQALDAILSEALEVRRAGQLLRARKLLRPLDAAHVQWEGRRLVNFASNNYLGLTHHPRLIEAMTQAIRQWGAGSGAAALVTGHTLPHAQAEAALARWKATQAALLLPSGYQANQAAVQMLAALDALPAAQARWPGGVRFLVDKLAHASLIEAVRGSGRPFRVFPHNHLGKLERLLETAPPGQLQIVVTESIFSMDGDAADLPGLASLKQRHPFVLLLDEAHASGVYGPGGSGYAAEVGLGAIVDVTVITLSKALGLAGGAICTSTAFRDALLNFAPAAIYSTNIPPALAAGTEAALGILADEPARQQRLRALSRYLREQLVRSDQMEGGAGALPDSPIVPLLLRHEGQALSAAEELRRRGLLVVAIRPPTVPRGGSRLRITLTCEHRDEEIDLLVRALKEVVPA
jgi:8-amino-7-oxononanoate synthase